MRITCPFCGPRDDAEFRYRGDATIARPAADAGAEAFAASVFERDNPKGWHLDWWQHVAGCRQVLKVKRHTVSHAIAWVGSATDTAPATETAPETEAAP